MLVENNPSSKFYLQKVGTSFDQFPKTLAKFQFVKPIKLSILYKQKEMNLGAKIIVPILQTTSLNHQQLIAVDDRDSQYSTSYTKIPKFLESDLDLTWITEKYTTFAHYRRNTIELTLTIFKFFQIEFINETLFKAISMFDLFFNKRFSMKFTENDICLTGLGCIVLSSKLNDKHKISIESIRSNFGFTHFRMKHFLDKELEILSALDYNVLIPCMGSISAFYSFSILGKFNAKKYLIDIIRVINQILVISLADISFNQYSLQIRSLAAVILASGLISPTEDMKNKHQSFKDELMHFIPQNIAKNGLLESVNFEKCLSLLKERIKNINKRLPTLKNICQISKNLKQEKPELFDK